MFRKNEEFFEYLLFTAVPHTVSNSFVKQYLYVYLIKYLSVTGF